jgi:hypothetical protein
MVALIAVAARGQTVERKLDVLIVYGDGFAFGVKEPAGWHADTADVARKYNSNVVYLPALHGTDGVSALIHVRVNRKQDENTAEDMNSDVEQYKKDYPGCQFKELDISHPEYRTFAKLFFVPTRFYEYVAYLNPGAGIQSIFSVALSTNRGSPASREELDAYQTVLRSIRWLSAGAKTPAQ